MTRRFTKFERLTHCLFSNFLFGDRPDCTEYNNLILTYKNIDKKTFFSIPVHFRSIDDIVKELEKPSDLKWPCRNEQEVQHWSAVNVHCTTSKWSDRIDFSFVVVAYWSQDDPTGCIGWSDLQVFSQSKYCMHNGAQYHTVVSTNQWFGIWGFHHWATSRKRVQHTSQLYYCSDGISGWIKNAIIICGLCNYPIKFNCNVHIFALSLDFSSNFNVNPNGLHCQKFDWLMRRMQHVTHHTIYQMKGPP